MDKDNMLIVQRRPGIGDMCIFLPFIHKISEENPNYNTLLLINKRSSAKKILKYDKFIKKIFYVNEKNFLYKYLQLHNIIKKEKIKKIVIFHYSFSLWILSKLNFIKNIYHYGNIKKNKSIVGDAFDLTSRIVKKKFDINCKIFLGTEPNKENLITIGIGGSGSTKKWKINYFAELVEKINKQFPDLKFLIAGGPEEKNDRNELIRLTNLDSKLFTDTCDLDLDDVINEISKSKLYIGNDTGFMHISGLLGIQSYGLFGDTPTNYTSYNENIFAIIPENYDNITHNSRAINKIKVNFVYSQIKKIIEKLF